LLVTVAATIITTPPAHAQIPLGTILVGDPIACPSGFYPGMTCLGAEVFCPNTDNIGVTIGYVGPTVFTTPQGTIVFFGGAGGTTASEPGSDILSFEQDYVQDFTIVNVAWASAWEQATASGAENILLAACRPATLLHWINGSPIVHSSGAMCAQGKSAGSAAVAYSMSWYGAGSYLTNVELLAGPVLSRIDDGCNPNPPTVSMCPSGGICTAGTISWSRNAGYTSDKSPSVNNWSGTNDCTQSSDHLQTWASMSIVDGSYSGVTPVFSFSTKRHGWICAGLNNIYDRYVLDCPSGSAYCPNNSSPQGYDWYAAASDSNLKVSGTIACDGYTTSTTSTEAEGVDGTNALDPDTGIAEKTQIENDMTGNCLLSH
jgi:hypothetical protein